MYLKEATEIKVDYKDIVRLGDFITEDWTCQADVVVYIPKDQLVDWSKINVYKDVLHIVIAVEDTDLIDEVKLYGYPVFWSYPASTYWELRGLLDLGVNQILLDAPLYFDLPKVKAICGDSVELRIVVNRCVNGYMKRRDGICGPYVRPEDVDVYSGFISHMEFDTDELQQERTLVKIYSVQKHWPGNLNLLLKYLGEDIDNRALSAIPVEGEDETYFARRRIACGQRCQENPTKCNFCKNTFALIKTIDRHAEELRAQINE